MSIQLNKAAEYVLQHAKTLEGAEAIYNNKYPEICTFGIEGVSCFNRHMEYVNMGDTYDATIIDYNGKLEIASWGGWYEDMQQEACEEENATQCAYCSELVHLDDQDEIKYHAEHDETLKDYLEEEEKL